MALRAFGLQNRIVLYAGVAQPVVQLIRNEQAVGSSPTTSLLTIACDSAKTP